MDVPIINGKSSDEQERARRLHLVQNAMQLVGNMVSQGIPNRYTGGSYVPYSPKEVFDYAKGIVEAADDFIKNESFD